MKFNLKYCHCKKQFKTIKRCCILDFGPIFGYFLVNIYRPIFFGTLKNKKQ